MAGLGAFCRNRVPARGWVRRCRLVWLSSSPHGSLAPLPQKHALLHVRRKRWRVGDVGCSDGHALCQRRLGARFSFTQPQQQVLHFEFCGLHHWPGARRSSEPLPIRDLAARCGSAQGTGAVSCPVSCAGTSCIAATAPLPAPTPLPAQSCPSGGATFSVPSRTLARISGCDVVVSAGLAGNVSFSNPSTGFPISCTYCGASCVDSACARGVATGLVGPSYAATLYEPFAATLSRRPRLWCLRCIRAAVRRMSWLFLRRLLP